MCALEDDKNGDKVLIIKPNSAVPELVAHQDTTISTFQRAKYFLAAHDLTSALDAFSASLQLALISVDQVGQGRAFQGIGMIADHRGDFDEALRAYQQALDCYRAVAYLTGQMLITNLIGIVMLQLHCNAEAHAAFQQSLAFATATDNPAWEAKARYWLEKIAQTAIDPLAGHLF